MSEQIITFGYEDDAPERLDKYLVGQMPEYSRARIQGFIANGHVDVNGQPARKAGQPLDTGSMVTVRIPPTVSTDILAEDIPLDIVFENEDIIVVNKAAGMVVHPSVGHSSGTLVNAILGYDADLEGIGGEERPGVVHRLDKDTSGLILLAKNERAHRWLQDQFRLRKVNKIYLALVDGKPPTPSGRVEAYIGRDPKQRKKMAIVSEKKGREAISEYITLEEFHKHTVLEFHPHTGRTHQIRLHCLFLNCPIAGDEIYGRKKSTIDAGRHFLHAYRLQIMLPDEKEPRTFEASLPKELELVLNKLRNG